jgi:hypothetical protein
MREELEQMRTAYASAAAAAEDQAPLPFDVVAPVMLGLAADPPSRPAKAPRSARARPSPGRD